MKQLLDMTNEPWPASAEKLSANPNLRALSAKELFNVCHAHHFCTGLLTNFSKLQAARDDYKAEYLEYWNSTSTLTSTGRPIDALLCPIAPSASFPHDFLP